MIIGIDLDDTICNTNEKLYEYQEKFIANENINVDTLWNNKIYKDKFLNMYLERIYNETKLKKILT